ncbi:MAG: hypothetical protein RLZZ293_320 [Pseudomonadota bacterium]
MVWNNLLDWRNKEYSLNGNKINYTKSSANLTELKNQEQFRWLNDVSSVALQQTLRSQDTAFSNFFAKRAKYPNFKPLHIRKWICDCGSTHDRDINAAINIHTAGLAGINA